MTCNDDKSDKSPLPNTSLVFCEPMVVAHSLNTNTNNGGFDEVSRRAYFEFSRPFKSFHTNGEMIHKRFSTNFGNGSSNSSSSSKNDNVTFVYEFALPSEAKKFKESNKLSQIKVSINNNNEKNFFNMQQENSNQNTSSTQSQQQRNHVVVVEQAPFSVFKSFKSQESNDKSSNNVTVINSLRNHPYDNAIRTSYTSNENNLKKNLPVSYEFSSQSLHNKTLNKTITTSNQSNYLNRNSSSNAILAQLKSISPNFKSIFVRPKHSKHIDSSSILNKAKLNNTNYSLLNESSSSTGSIKYGSNNSMSSILNLLYNNSANIKSNETLSVTGFSKTKDNSKDKLLQNHFLIDSSSRLINILPNTEPRDLRLNSSVDELLKKFSNEGSGYTSITTLSSSSSSHSSIDKWTCMVCLSKHLEKIEICSICGSSRPTKQTSSILTTPLKQHQRVYTSATSPAPSTSSSTSVSPSSQQVFTSYLFNELGLKHKLASAVGGQQQLKISTHSSSSLSNHHDQSKGLSPKPINPYLKKWTCIHCNYSNDSLKIVCLNCRWVKTSTTSVSSSITSPPSSSTSSTLTGSSLNTTASLSNDELSPLSTSFTQKNENRSNIETDSTPKKIHPPTETYDKSDSNNNNTFCASCKSPLHESSSSTIQSKSTLLQPVMPNLFNKLNDTSPLSFVQNKPIEQEPGKLSFFAQLPPKTSNDDKTLKWNCTTCLVTNVDSNDKCVCCAAPKPSLTTKNDINTKKTPSSFQTKPFGFGSSISSKWTCKTCLVSNDAEKSKCVCCQTDKPVNTETSSQNKTCFHCHGKCVCFEKSKPSVATQNDINTKETPSSFQTKPFIGFGTSLSSKWTCKTCLVSNDADKSKCACCQTDKPANTEATSQKWTCSSCLVKNEADKLKCACCHADKPSLSKPASKKWPCSTCLVNNDDDKLKCVCCQSDKPSTSLSSSLVSSSSEPLSLFTKKNSLSTQPTIILPENVQPLNVSSSIKFGMNSSSSEPIKFGSSNSFFGAKKTETITSTTTAASSSDVPPKLDSFFKMPETTKPDDKKTEIQDQTSVSSMQFSFKPLETKESPAKISFGNIKPFDISFSEKTSASGLFNTSETKPSETTKLQIPSLTTSGSNTSLFSFGTTTPTTTLNLNSTPTKAITSNQIPEQPFSLFKATMPNTNNSSNQLFASNTFTQNNNLPSSSFFQTPLVKPSTEITPTTTATAPSFFSNPLLTSTNESQSKTLFGSTNIFGTSTSQTSTSTPSLFNKSTFGSTLSTNQPALNTFGSTATSSTFPQFSLNSTSTPSQSTNVPSLFSSNQTPPNAGNFNFQFGAQQNDINPNKKFLNNNHQVQQTPQQEMANSTAASSFVFNPNTNLNFNFMPANPNGVIQFSGANDSLNSNMGSATERRFRKARRTHR